MISHWFVFSKRTPESIFSLTSVFFSVSIKRLKVALLQDKISQHAQYQLLHKTTCFYLIRATGKKVQLGWTFFQSLVNDDLKVSKTQRISAKIDRFKIRLIVWIVMQLISRSETWKANLKFAVEQKHGKLFSVHRKTWKAFSIYFYSSSCCYFISKISALFIIMISLSCFKAEAVIGRHFAKIAVQQCSFCVFVKALRNAC